MSNNIRHLNELNDDGTISPSFKIQIGDEVHDDLTNTLSKIVKITEDKSGNLGIWLDNEYLGGGRHPWEISNPSRLKLDEK